MNEFILVISLVANLNYPTLTYAIEGPMNLWECTVREQQVRGDYINKVGLERASKELSALCWPVRN